MLPTLRRRSIVRASLPTTLALVAGCSSPSTMDASVPTDVYIHPSTPITGCAGADATTPTFCSLGADVPGATVPAGFCLRRFATVSEARTLSIAPNGDVFVGAPSKPTRGGAGGGPGAVVVVSDDDHDGTGEVAIFARDASDVQGIALTDDWLYFTSAHTLLRTPYTLGQRNERVEAREQVATYTDTIDVDYRDTHALAMSPAGTLYTSQGVDSARMCPDTPRDGMIESVASNTMTTVAQGFRNPLYMRCHFADEICLASELGDDGGGDEGAHEKLVRVGAGAQFGFPCCTTTGHPTHLDLTNRFDCNQVTPEEVSFPLNDTPFGLDWERGCWPAPYTNGLFVALHGSFYNPWQGAGIRFAPTTAAHLPTGEFTEFAGGFGPGGGILERPADVAFSPDGRLFFADDHAGAIYWVAPTTLHMPATD